MRPLLRPLLFALLLAPLVGCEEVPLDPAASRAALDEARRIAAGAANGGAGVPRLGGLERQYGEAIARVADEHGAERAAALLLRRERLLDAARTAARAGQRSAAQAGFEGARREQIRVVLDVLGAARVAVVLDAVTEAAERAGADVAAARFAGSSHERMLRTAAELLVRARAAWDAGDAATALDLASHAAGLVDTVRLRLADAG
jgi:hypothetical protein